MKLVLVIAGSYREYLHYIRGQRQPGKTYLYVDQDRDIAGIRRAEVKYIGEYWKNPLYGSEDLDRIEEE